MEKMIGLRKLKVLKQWLLSLVGGGFFFCFNKAVKITEGGKLRKSKFNQSSPPVKNLVQEKTSSKNPKL